MKVVIVMEIKVINVSKAFKDEMIIEDVNLEMTGGHIYGLIGRNGSGKSVFLKLLCGFLEPTTGKILVDGENFIKNKTFPKSTRALIEKPTFIPDLSGSDNLILLANIQKKISNKEINETLRRVNLNEVQNKLYCNYSLGMKQKLGIAQVLMEEPEIMIFDEPFNGIEQETVEKLRKELLKEKKKGKLIIISSHMKEDIELLADTIYKFEGRKVSKL